MSPTSLTHGEDANSGASTPAQIAPMAPSMTPNIATPASRAMTSLRAIRSRKVDLAQAENQHQTDQIDGTGVVESIKADLSNMRKEIANAKLNAQRTEDNDKLKANVSDLLELSNFLKTAVFGSGNAGFDDEASLRQQVLDLQSQLRPLSDQVSKLLPLSDQVSKLLPLSDQVSSLQQLKTDIQAVRVKMENVSNENSGLSSQITSLEERHQKLEALTKDSQNVDQPIKTLSGNLSRLSNDLKNLTEWKAELPEPLIKKDMENLIMNCMSSISPRLHTLEKDAAAFKSSTKKKDGDIEVLSKKVSDLSAFQKTVDEAKIIPRVTNLVTQIEEMKAEDKRISDYVEKVERQDKSSHQINKSRFLRLDDDIKDLRRFNEEYGSSLEYFKENPRTLEKIPGIERSLDIVKTEFTKALANVKANVIIAEKRTNPTGSLDSDRNSSLIMPSESADLEARSSVLDRSAQQELEEHALTLDRLQAQIIEVTSRNRETRCLNDELNGKKLPAVQKQLRDLCQGKIQKLEDDVQDLKTSVSNASLPNLETRLEELNKELGKIKPLEEKIEAFQTRINQAKLPKLETDLQELKAFQTNINETVLPALDGQFKTLRTELGEDTSALETEFLTFKTEMGDEKLPALTSRLGALETDNAKIVDLQNSKISKEELNTRTSDLKKQIETSREESNARASKLEKQLEASSKVSEERTSKLEKQFEASTKVSKERTCKLGEQIETFNKVSEERTSQLEKQMEAAEKKLDASPSALDVLRQDIKTDTENQLGVIRKHLGKVETEELANLRSHIDGVQSQILETVEQNETHRASLIQAEGTQRVALASRLEVVETCNKTHQAFRTELEKKELPDLHSQMEKIQQQLDHAEEQSKNFPMLVLNVEELLSKMDKIEGPDGSLSTLDSRFQDMQQKLHGVEKQSDKVPGLELQMQEIEGNIKPLDTKLQDLEAKLGPIEKISTLESGLKGLEDQLNQVNSTLTSNVSDLQASIEESKTHEGRLLTIETKLVTIDKGMATAKKDTQHQITLEASRSLELDKRMKDEISRLDKRITTVTQLETDVKALKANTRSFKQMGMKLSNLERAQNEMSQLPQNDDLRTLVESIRSQVEDHVEQYAKDYEDIEMKVHGLGNDTSTLRNSIPEWISTQESKVESKFELQMETLRGNYRKEFSKQKEELERKVTTSCDQLQTSITTEQHARHDAIQDLLGRDDVRQHAISSLEERYNNISTAWIHQYMVQWLMQHYPTAPGLHQGMIALQGDIQKAQADVQKVQADVRKVQTETTPWIGFLNSNNTEMHRLPDTLKRVDKLALESQTTTSTIKKHVEKLEKLDIGVSTALDRLNNQSSTLKELKNQTSTLEELKQQMSTLKELENTVSSFNEKISREQQLHLSNHRREVQSQLKGMDTKLKEMSQEQNISQEDIKEAQNNIKGLQNELSAVQDILTTESEDEQFVKKKEWKEEQEAVVGVQRSLAKLDDQFTSLDKRMAKDEAHVSHITRQIDGVNDITHHLLNVSTKDIQLLTCLGPSLLSIVHLQIAVDEINRKLPDRLPISWDSFGGHVLEELRADMNGENNG
ncbi:hypothetical protein BS50DRAFT_579455 [Corynespora cassiicola Philippines]|uniref:Uncharacterized protein n=1 Tax=Corynespora cassiicola Philippines TaxID=1448308 RepID=A0A2T2N4H8_CORCC|nr:hypothetical protein BS50DRAFT_579455 [Corynespora cassiicola Philippines]